MESSQASDITSDISSDVRKVAVFWDYENLAVPSGIDASEACQSISRAVSKYGRITDRRIYFNFLDSAQPPSSSWDKFDSSGFDLVNTPRRGNRKETLDKKLIADLWAFAWDNSKPSDGIGTPCVVLLTGDGDFAYTLNKLRDRGVYCIVIHGLETSVSSILQDSATVCLDFHTQVLRAKTPKPKMQEPSTTPYLVPSKTMPPSNENMAIEQQPSPATTKPKVKKLSVPVSVVGCSVAPEEEPKLLCKLISNQEESSFSSADGWVKAACLGSEFRLATVGNLVTGIDHKTRFSKARDQAIQNGWAQRGWRNKVTNNSQEQELLMGEKARLAGSAKGEDYLRLTQSGRRLILVAAGTAAGFQQSAMRSAKKSVAHQEEKDVSPVAVNNLLQIVLNASITEMNNPRGMIAGEDQSAFYNWVEGGSVGNTYIDGESSAVDAKPLFVNAKEFALNRNLIERGWRIVTENHARNSGEKVIVAEAHISPHVMLGENYVRLTERGIAFLTTDRPQVVDGDTRHALIQDQERLPNIKSPLQESVRAPREEEARDVAQQAANKSAEQPQNAKMTTTNSSDLFRDAKVVCKIVSENTITPPSSWIAICEKGSPSYTWVEGGKIGKTFREKPGVAMEVEAAKAQFGAAANMAIELGWIERGWRVLNSSDDVVGKVIETANNIPATATRGESYLRMTKSGATAIKQQSKPAPPESREDNLRSRSLFIKNVPRAVSTQDLARYLQVNHGCKIVLALGKEIYPPGKGAFWFIRVQVASGDQATMLLLLSKQAKLFLHGRQLEVIYDKHPPTSKDLTSNSVYYPTTTDVRSKAPSRTPSPTDVQARLFVKNVSRKTSIQRLVVFLESMFSCTVLRAKIEKDRVTANSEYFFAKVQLSDGNDARRILTKNAGRAKLDGRALEFSYDKFPITTVSGDCAKFPEIYYERDYFLSKEKRSRMEITKEENYGVKSIPTPMKASPPMSLEDGTASGNDEAGDSHHAQSDEEKTVLVTAATATKSSIGPPGGNQVRRREDIMNTFSPADEISAFSRLIRKFAHY